MVLLYEKNGMVIYKRQFSKEVSIIAINNSSKTQTVSIPLYKLKENKELRGLINGDLVRSSEEGYTIVLNREEAEVYTLAKKTGINIPYLIVMGLIYSTFIIFILVLRKRAKRKRKFHN